MSEKILFIELFQPYAQYRNPFTFYYAQTYPLPPKSTILGMLQNAAGDWYGNKHKEAWDKLKISIHGGFESIFWNYQRLIKDETFINVSGKLINQSLPLYGGGLTSMRTPVYQQELFNGHLFLFLKGDGKLINEIKKCLEKPKKVLYLGRSEDVLFIKRVEEIKDEQINRDNNVKRDLWLTFPTYIKWQDFPIKNEKYPVFFIPKKITFENKGMGIKTKSEITKATERKPEFETVIYTGYDYSIHLNKEDKEGIKVEKIEIKEPNGELKMFKISTDYGWL